MTKAFFGAGFRATDSDDNPLAGGTARYYAAGTTTPKAVYSDFAASVSLGSVVNLNSAGLPVSGSNVPVIVYPGTGSYRVRYYDADGVLVPGMDFDNIPGKDVETEAATTALPTTPVSSITTSGTHTIADRGKLFNCNPTGGSFARTLPSAVTAGDNFRIGFRHSGSANQVAILAPGTQNIRGQRVGKSFPLVGMGEAVWLVSDGSDWIVDSYSPPFRKATGPYWIVLDRLTAPPANPDAGARYLVNGTPTGSWSTLGFAEHDIAEADGNGSWIRHVPEPGWQAFDVDEEVSLVFRNDQWENFQVDPGTSVLSTFVVQDQKSSGTAGGDAATSAWTTAVLNTSVTNTIDGASLASNKITLPAGTYLIDATKSFTMTKLSRLRFKTADSNDIIRYGNSAYIGDYDSNSDGRTETGGVLTVKTVVTIAATTDFILQYHVSETPSGGFANHGLGSPTSLGGTAEVYATVSITSLTALEGPKGDQGDQGAIGPQGDTGTVGPTGSTNYNFDSSTTDADPGSGDLRLNNATPASATTIYFDNNNRSGVDISSWLNTFDDTGASGGRGYLHIMDAAAPTTVFRIYLVTGSVVDGTGYRKVSVTHVTGAGSFTNGNELLVSFFPRGQAGAGLADVVDDTTPQLGGNLDMNGFQIQASGVSINPIGKQTLVIPAAAWAPTITNGAGRSYAELPTNDIISETLDFDTTTQEFATFEWFPPQRWNGGTVTFRFRWRADGGTPAQTVEMALSGRAIADDQFEDGAFGTAVAVSDALIATTDHHVSSESSAVTIGNTPGKGRKVALKLQRNVSNDDLSVDAKIEAIELFFTTDAATDA